MVYGHATLQDKCNTTEVTYNTTAADVLMSKMSMFLRFRDFFFEFEHTEMKNVKRIDPYPNEREIMVSETTHKIYAQSRIDYQKNVNK